MAFGVGGKRTLNSQINVTPMVDVVLVLLIIFMVVTPLLHRGQDVQLPAAKSESAQEAAGSDLVVISLTAEKRLYVDSTEVVTEAALATALRSRLAAQPKTKLVLKADERLRYRDIRAVMKVAREAGGAGLALGVQEAGGQEAGGEAAP